MNKITPSFLLVSLSLFLVACSTTSVKTTPTESIIQPNPTAPVSEELLLDVGIDIFEPVPIENNKEVVAEFSQILKAEANYIPIKIAETVQSSGNWGAVRVVPNKQSEMDVWIDGQVIKSDGATLKLDITVRDATNKLWYSRRYQGEATRFAYKDRANKRNTEPFQYLYNQIANDLVRYYENINNEEIASIRTVSQLQFAQRFSPEAFGNHTRTDNKGHLFITRLPAKNDPLLQRIETIRERDNLFVDTLQDYYNNFARKMEAPYYEWRRAYYEEGEALRKVKAQSNQRLIGGALAVLAGIFSQNSGSAAARTAGSVAILGGAAAVISGLNKREEAKIHIEALQEISASLDAEIEPHTLSLKERSVTLTGSVTDQYGQWREILRDIYNNETGQI